MIQSLCKNNNWECPIVKYVGGDSDIYVKFLKDRKDGYDGLEGNSIHKELNVNDFENNVNSLFYDVEEKVIIDIFGNGVMNCIEKKFSLPPNLEKGIWISDNNYDRLKAIIRVFKMFAKGFTLIDEDNERFKEIFYKELDNLQNKVYPDTNISVINYVLCSMVRSDIIDKTTGELLKIGDNKDKFNEILLAIKDYDKDIYKIILKETNKIILQTKKRNMDKQIKSYLNVKIGGVKSKKRSKKRRPTKRRRHTKRRPTKRRPTKRRR